MQNMKKSIIQDKSFEFSLAIIDLYKQLLRSGTSIGANIEEASAGQSKKDFTAKMSIASKEARETLYWLKLLQRSQLAKRDYSEYLNFIEEIINILTAIVKTSQSNIKQGR